MEEAILQTIDKVPGLHRGFFSVVIDILIIFLLFVSKKSPLAIRKLRVAFSVYGMNIL